MNENLRNAQAQSAPIPALISMLGDLVANLQSCHLRTGTALLNLNLGSSVVSGFRADITGLVNDIETKSLQISLLLDNFLRNYLEKCDQFNMKLCFDSMQIDYLELNDFFGVIKEMNAIHLIQIDLRRNQLSDRGLSAICCLCSSAPNLSLIDLRQNSMTNEAVDYIGIRMSLLDGVTKVVVKEARAHGSFSTQVRKGKHPANQIIQIFSGILLRLEVNISEQLEGGGGDIPFLKAPACV